MFLRAAAAGGTAFLVGILLGPAILQLLRRWKLGERTDKSASEELNRRSVAKKNTPTMGGMMLLPALAAAMLLWGNFSNRYVLLAFLGTLGFSLIGAIDDLIKLRYPDRRGLTSLAKLLLQCLVSLALAFALWMHVRGREDGSLLELSVPFLDVALDLSVWGGLPYLAAATLIMVATSNAVNLADGMDGLAPGLVGIAAVAFTVVAFAVGRPDYAEYLSVAHVTGAQEMGVVAAGMAGALMAFLWFNCFPAQVFLGDTGSLPLGGLLGYVAIVTKQELLLPIVGAVLVAEVLSVMLQVASFRMRGRRIFRCAPIHHHFQFAGVHEVKIVVRFWIVGVLCALLGLASLKFT